MCESDTPLLDEVSLPTDFSYWLAGWLTTIVDRSVAFRFRPGTRLFFCQLTVVDSRLIGIVIFFGAVPFSKSEIPIRISFCITYLGTHFYVLTYYSADYVLTD